LSTRARVDIVKADVEQIERDRPFHIFRINGQQLAFERLTGSK